MVVINSIGDQMGVDLNETFEALGGNAGVKEGGVEGNGSL